MLAERRRARAAHEIETIAVTALRERIGDLRGDRRLDALAEQIVAGATDPYRARGRAGGRADRGLSAPKRRRAASAAASGAFADLASVVVAGVGVAVGVVVGVVARPVRGDLGLCRPTFHSCSSLPELCVSTSQPLAGRRTVLVQVHRGHRACRPRPWQPEPPARTIPSARPGPDRSSSSRSLREPRPCRRRGRSAPVQGVIGGEHVDLPHRAPASPSWSSQLGGDGGARRLPQRGGDGVGGRSPSRRRPAPSRRPRRPRRRPRVPSPRVPSVRTPLRTSARLRAPYRRRRRSPRAAVAVPPATRAAAVAAAMTMLRFMWIPPESYGFASIAFAFAVHHHAPTELKEPEAP